MPEGIFFLVAVKHQSYPTLQIRGCHARGVAPHGVPPGETLLLVGVGTPWRDGSGMPWGKVPMAMCYVSLITCVSVYGQ